MSAIAALTIGAALITGTNALCNHVVQPGILQKVPTDVCFTYEVTGTSRKFSCSQQLQLNYSTPDCSGTPTEQELPQTDWSCDDLTCESDEYVNIQLYFGEDSEQQCNTFVRERDTNFAVLLDTCTEGADGVAECNPDGSLKWCFLLAPDGNFFEFDSPCAETQFGESVFRFNYNCGGDIVPVFPKSTLPEAPTSTFPVTDIYCDHYINEVGFRSPTDICVTESSSLSSIVFCENRTRHVYDGPDCQAGGATGTDDSFTALEWLCGADRPCSDEDLTQIFAYPNNADGLQNCANSDTDRSLLSFTILLDDSCVAEPYPGQAVCHPEGSLQLCAGDFDAPVEVNVDAPCSAQDFFGNQWVIGYTCGGVVPVINNTRPDDINDPDLNCNYLKDTDFNSRVPTDICIQDSNLTSYTIFCEDRIEHFYYTARNCTGDYDVYELNDTYWAWNCPGQVCDETDYVIYTLYSADESGLETCQAFDRNAFAMEDDAWLVGIREEDCGEEVGITEGVVCQPDGSLKRCTEANPDGVPFAVVQRPCDVLFDSFRVGYECVGITPMPSDSPTASPTDDTFDTASPTKSPTDSSSGTDSPTKSPITASPTTAAPTSAEDSATTDKPSAAHMLNISVFVVALFSVCYVQL